MRKNKIFLRKVLVTFLSLMIALGIFGIFSQAAEIEIPVGFLMGFTGDMATYAEDWLAGTQLAIEEVNKAGGPLGLKIKLYTADDKSSVEGGIGGARKLITVNKVVALLGCTSDTLLAIRDFALENEVLIISATAGTVKLDESGGKYVFRTVASDSFDGRVVAKYITERGYKTVGMIIQNEENPLSYGKAVKKGLASENIKLVAEAIINPGQTSYRSAIEEVYGANPEFVILATDFELNGIIVKQAYEFGYTEHIDTLLQFVVPDVITLAGKEAIEGVYGESPVAPRTPAYESFVKKYRAFTGKEEHMLYTPNFYDAANILALAIEAAGEVNFKAIIENIRKVSNPPGIVVNNFAEGIAELRKGNKINYEGAVGPLDFDEFGNVVTSGAIFQVKDGNWVEVAFIPGESLEW